MMIPILSELEARNQWVEFFQREQSYAQVKRPNCRIALQATYLQLTRLDLPQPIRYTLGSRSSIEPVWDLISRCDWSLKALVEGLDGLALGASVRELSGRDWSADLSVRRSIPREQQLYTEAELGAWSAPSKTMRLDSLNAICSVIAWRKISDWESQISPLQWLLEVQDFADEWQIRHLKDGTIQLTHPHRPDARFKPRL